MILEKLSNKVNPKKITDRSIWKGEIDQISWQNWEHEVRVGGLGKAEGKDEEGGKGWGEFEGTG